MAKYGINLHIQTDVLVFLVVLEWSCTERNLWERSAVETAYSVRCRASCEARWKTSKQKWI